MEAPDIHILNRINWQFFGTLTFKKERMSDKHRLSMFTALIDEYGRSVGVPFRFLPWYLRGEKGEMTARRHYHYLLSGVPDTYVGTISCFAQMKIWESLGGGMARVRVFDSRLNAAGYILKVSGLDETTALGAENYESAKFGNRSTELIASKRALELARRTR